MGIRDLWQALSPVQQTRTFTEIGVREGFEPTRRPDRCLRIGIDARSVHIPSYIQPVNNDFGPSVRRHNSWISIWMSQAQATITYTRGPGTRLGENPALRILFYRLCRLSALPVIPIFVFDGSGRPLVKRGVQVKSGKPHGLKAGFTAFIKAFGFFWFTAAGEADVDLAELNKRDLIDAVMSEDSDVMVYGTRTVIRMENSRTAGDLIHIYDSRKIEADPRVKLTREGLFFMALLCGGDYDKTGLPGCGWKTALLLSQTKLAGSLFVAASTSTSRERLREFLRGWRKEFSAFLTTDPDGHLGRKYPGLAKAVEAGAGFPSIDTLLLYAQPASSWGGGEVVPDHTAWILSEPNLSSITSLSEKYFSWGSADKSIVNRFKDNIWEGVAVRHFLSLPSLYDQLVSYSQNESAPGGAFTTSNVLRIRQEKIGPGGPATHSNVTGYTIEVSTATLLRAMGLGLSDVVRSVVTESNLSKALLWIPSSILSSVLPAIVQEFRVRRKLPEAVPTAYQPVLQPLSVLGTTLISLDSAESECQTPFPLAGPSTQASHGSSISDPIVIDSDSIPHGSGGPTTPANTNPLARTSSAFRRRHKGQILDFIDLC